MDLILYERHGSVAVLTLNRPDARNPISEPDMVQALEDAVADINRDRSVRAVVLTGAGSAFSSGVNESESMRCAARGSPRDASAAHHSGMYVRVHVICRRKKLYAEARSHSSRFGMVTDGTNL